MKLPVFKNALPWTYVISDFNDEEIVRMFCEKELQKTNQTDFRIEKVIKRKGNKLYLNGKVMIILLIAGLIKKISKHKIKVELKLENYATKST